MRGLGLGLGLGGGNVSAAALPSFPSTNLLAWWSAHSVTPDGSGGVTSVADLSGGGHPLTNVGATHAALTASDPKMGSGPSLSSTAASSGLQATLASFAPPLMGYLIGYPGVTNGDLVTIGTAIMRLFAAISGGNANYAFRVPDPSHAFTTLGANTVAQACAFAINASAGTFSAYMNASTPAAVSGLEGTLTSPATLVQLINGNLGGVFSEFALYSAIDSQPAIFSKLNVGLARSNLPLITS